MTLLPLLVLLAGGVPAPRHAPPALRVTVLYDAFTERTDLHPDWGYSALIEYRGKRILFDTGDNAAILRENARRLRVDLRRLDLVVISHRHSDHTAGLPWVLHESPKVPVYAPREGFSMFGGAIPRAFFRTDTLLPRAMRYFDGDAPAVIPTGTLFPDASIILVDSLTEVAPGIHLVATVSSTPGTLELRELSLLLDTPDGLVVVVGCSHPGIETILGASAAAGSRFNALVGGLHLVAAPDSVVATLAEHLRSVWHVARLAVGHCTGEPAFRALRAAYGADYLYAGLGSTLTFP
jgi:7,8-dihydropterin-6-yl-methyl-4-(beta-D-ribofuranosyl)aminobenzene 5'-phosphate synthase